MKNDNDEFKVSSRSIKRLNRIIKERDAIFVANSDAFDANLVPWKDIFLRKVPWRDKVRNVVRLPTPKQWDYVRLFLSGKSKRDAYIAAGYTVQMKNRTMLDCIEAVHNAPAVQKLITLVIQDYLEKRKISSQFVLDKALKLYDRSETVSEQLNILKFIKDLLPSGYVCKRTDCGMHKPK